MSDTTGGFDTSSYNQPLPVSPLDIAKQVGGLLEQKLNIDQKKLDQANQGLTYMTRAMGSVGPNASKEEYLKVAKNAVEMGLVPANMLHIYEQRLQASPDSQTFYKEFMTAAQDHQKQIEMHTGQNVAVDSGNKTYFGKRNILTGGVTPSNEIAAQPPPTQNTVDDRRTLPNGQPNPRFGQPGIIGAAGPQGFVPSLPAAPPQAPPVSASPVRAPVTVDPNYRRPLPVERPAAPGMAPAAPPQVSGPTGPTVQTGYNFDERFGAAYPNRVATGLAPGTSAAVSAVSEQSGKDFAAALTRGKNLQADLQPDLAVLDIVKGKAPGDFGPGTDSLNQLKKLAVTWLPNVDPKIINDSSNYDVVKKYLIQGARASGNTGSDNQLAAAFEANPNTTMNTATIENIVKTRVALRKMEAAMTLLAANSNVPEEQYSKWVAKNQNQFDPRAFGFDLMDQTAKEKLYGQLKKDPKAYQKFEKTLQFAADAKLVGQ